VVKYLISILFIFFSNLVLSEELFLSCIATEEKHEHETFEDSKYTKEGWNKKFDFLIDDKKIIIDDYKDYLLINKIDLSNKEVKIKDTTETHLIYKLTENTCGLDLETKFCGNLNLEFIIHRYDLDFEIIQYLSEIQSSDEKDIDFYKSLKIFTRYKCLEKTKRL